MYAGDKPGSILNLLINQRDNLDELIIRCPVCFQKGFQAQQRGLAAPSKKSSKVAS